MGLTSPRASAQMALHFATGRWRARSATERRNGISAQDVTPLTAKHSISIAFLAEINTQVSPFPLHFHPL